jgi:hypothetical protein
MDGRLGSILPTLEFGSRIVEGFAMTRCRLLLLPLALMLLAVSPSSWADEYRPEVNALSYHLEHGRAVGEPISSLSSHALVPPPVLLPSNAVDGPDIPVTPENDRTQSENSTAVSPLDNMVVLNSNNSTDWPVTTLFGTSWFLSTDGGQTWTGESEGPDGVGNRGDPAAAIDLNGTLYIGYIDANGGQGVSFSTNMGDDWTHRTIASLPTPPGRFDLLDKNHFTVDNVPTSSFAGTLYSAWTELVSGGPNDNDIVLSFSANGGNNWSALANLSNGVAAGSHNQGVNIQSGPNGEVYVVWSIYDSFPSDETAIGFNSSTNGGVTWLGESRIITGIRGIRQTTLPNESTRANSFPSMAVDVSGGPRDGWIYIFWTNIGVPGVNTGDADIYMSRSADGGNSWSTPIRVNDDSTTNAQWFPWATADPVTGDLSVVFYDRRDDSGDLLTTEYVAHSTDGGSTWTNVRVGDVQFTPAPISGLAGGYMGDYLGIAARACHIYPTWGDNATTPFTTYVSPIVIDDRPPQIECNAPEAIVPPDAPISFTATATDVCDDGVGAEVTAFDCFKFTRKGRRVDKTESCAVAFAGDTVTILDSGGVGDHISWTVVATDESGNSASVECELTVENPGKGNT